MSDDERSSGEKFEHGIYGALLALLIFISVMLFAVPFHWSYLIGFAIAGFLLGAFFGRRAIEILKEIFHLA